MKVSHCTEVFAKRSMTQSAAVIPSKCMQNLLLVWQFWKKTYHLANFIFLFFIVFNGCLQIRWTCFFWTRRIKGISVCRGLVMPGATAWLYAPYQILVLSSGVCRSLWLDDPLFETSQYDVIFTFANPRFRQVCWHKHIIVHALSLLVVVQRVTVMNINHQCFKLGDPSKTQH